MTDQDGNDKQDTADASNTAGEASKPAADGEPRMVECVKFGKSKLGMTKAPIKGDLGQKVYDGVSQEAWRMWLEHSKMLINEYRLDLISEQGQRVWMDELEKYFWGEGSQLPPDFVPAKAK
jgi:Fe-S cluster biosynthesis and repair protein YggX